MRINFYLLRTFVLILVIFVLFQRLYSVARGAAERGVESLPFQMSIVRRKRFQILPKPTRRLLGQKRGAIDNDYGSQ